MPPLEHTSLLTPESAREAVQKLDAVHSEIQQKIRTAQALRKLLENQRK
jgi:predicted RNA-binding protein associated with RNAse of E/G family